MQSSTIFNDPVHGTIEMHPLCLKIIDTPEFQRLRNLKQCGICHFVYPSAIHTRFEHSIGVYHLAGLFLNKIKYTVAISPQENLCVRVAALLHDIGHGPFSHLWERFVNGRNEEVWKHEQMSLKIFDYLMGKDEISKEFEKFELTVDHINLIRNIISGDRKSFPSEKLFLLEIVANKITNIDVDRWEYMMRDAYFFGVICTVRTDRIASNVRVIQVENNEHRIAFRDKLSENILEMFYCRMKLHKICYQHRVCKNIDIMLIDALNAADEKFFGHEELKLSNCHNNIHSFLKLSDSLFENILYSTDEKLQSAKAIIERIITRDLYDLESTLVLKEAVPDKDLMQIEKSLNFHYGTSLRLGLIDINMGIDGEDPLKHVLFYSKAGEILKPPNTNYMLSREIKLLIFSTKKIEDEPLKNKLLAELRKELNKFLKNSNEI